ncbi:MAG: RDD family protein [Candidatus Bathyarchaeia archaeon]|jgi:uncharacterized RDD family membrane protein YckC
MAVDEENISKLFILLSNKIRRDVLVILSEAKEQSFSDLMNTLDVDTGTMSFHLRKLKLLLNQTPTGKYRLNKFGHNALRLIKDMEALSIEADFLERKTTLHIAKFYRRALAFIVDMGMAFVITIVATLAAEVFALFTGEFLYSFNIFVFLGFLWLYSTLLEGFAGQTLGKNFFGIKVVSVSGKKLNYDSAAVRNFGKCFLLPIDLLVGLRLNDVRFIKFFDKFSGTTVIKL